ncbi:MAG: hypothetical protein H6737_26225 [Alphaproteobacteria bacterium]|nr:hypothetical protein [Alphaproteobacteria bacterium]
MRERTVDVDGIEVEVRTAFGKAQVPVIAVACSFAVVAMLAAGVLLVPRSHDEITLERSIRDYIVDEPSGAIPGIEGLRTRGRASYERCRTAQILDDVHRTRSLPVLLDGGYNTVRRLVEDVDFENVRCRPESWLGLGSQLDVLPVAIEEGEPVENPLWGGAEHASVEALAEAELALWYRIGREYDLIQAGPQGASAPTSVPYAVPTPQTVRVRDDAPLGTIAGLAGAAVALLMLVLGLAFVPDRQRFRFDLRGIRLGDAFVPAAEITGVWVESGRLVVARRDGTHVTSALLDDPDALQPLISQYQLLSTVRSSRMPAAMRKLVGSARKE